MTSAMCAGDPAAALLEARLAGVALAAFPRPVPTTLADAYACQQRLCASLGGRVLGWKVGRIPGPLVERLGAERLAGPVLRCAELGDAPGIARIFVGGAGAIESEVMLRVDRVPDEVPATDEAARALIGDVRAGFEVASSPAPDVHDHAPFGIIADIGINNGILLGPRLDPEGFDRLTVETRIDGAVVGTGCPRDILDGPWGSLRFLVDLHRRGVIAMVPGQWISAGAVTGVHPIAPGQTATATFGPALAIACTAAPDSGYAQ